MGFNNYPSFETFEPKKSKIESSINDKNTHEKVTLLPKINDILGQFGIDEKTEDRYRKILLKTDIHILKDLLIKPKIQIEHFLIQVQIKELKAKGIANLTDEEFDKLDELSDKLIALENKKQAEENKKQAEENKKQAEENKKQEKQKKLIALEKQETVKEKQETVGNEEIIAEKREKRKAYEEVNLKLSSIKGSLDMVNGKNENISTILAMINQADKYKINPEEATKNEVIESTGKMNEVLDNLILFLKQNPGALKSITDALGGANKNNSKYTKFKEVILSVDSSFKPFFDDLENIKSGKSLSADKVIEGVEKDSGGLVDVELGERPPVSKLRLLGSDYGFDKEIDKKALAEVTDGSREELNEIKEFGFDVLKDFKQNFAKKSFDFGKMQDIYDYFDIKGNDQIKLNDLEDFRNAETKEEKNKIFEEKIKPKIEKIEKVIKQKQTGILKQYEAEIKEIVLREKTRKKEQLETLKFIHNLGFDIIPQNITNKIIKQISSNSIVVKGINLNPKNLDLENGNFGETSSVDEDGTKWKENLIMFMNKMIYGEIEPKDSPLTTKKFLSVGNPTVNRPDLKALFEDKDIFVHMSWNIDKMIENLKK